MKFKKKPIIIEAFQVTNESLADKSKWPNWLKSAWEKSHLEDGAFYNKCIMCGDACVSLLCVNTLEGEHIVSLSDWIIKGVLGEIYPCKNEVFELTYDPA